MPPIESWGQTNTPEAAGYLSVDLIDSPENIDKSKVDAANVLTAIHFTAGARYEDHKSDDKSSGMGRLSGAAPQISFTP